MNDLDYVKTLREAKRIAAQLLPYHIGDALDRLEKAYVVLDITAPTVHAKARRIITALIRFLKACREFQLAYLSLLHEINKEEVLPHL